MADRPIPARSEVPEESTWNLKDVFESNEAWQAEYEAFKAVPEQIEAFRGRLGESAETLLEWFRLNDALSVRLEKLYGYANCKGDEDTGNGFYQGMRAKALATLVAIDAASAFETPEIMALDEDTVNLFYAAQPELETYRRNIYKIRRRKAHILSPEEEKLLSAAGEMANGPENIASVFRDADLTFPAVTDGEGNERVLTSGTFVPLLMGSDRVLRKNAFEAYYNRFGEFKNTVAAALDGQFRYSPDMLQVELEKVREAGVDIDKTREKALNIALNKITGAWDDSLLADLLKDIEDSDFDLGKTGFDPPEIETLFNKVHSKEVKEDDFDVESELKQPTFSQAGDLWMLGRHRVLCGDSTKAECYDTLMDGVKANLVLSDPPYNVDVEETAGKIMNDNMGDSEFYEFLLASFKQMHGHLADDGSIYIFHADTEGLNFRKAFKDAGFYLSGCCIWKKNALVLGRSPYQWQHEPCLYGWKLKGKHQWYSDRKQTTIWEYDRPKANKDHPTMKPIGLMSYPIRNSTMTNGIVLDPFLGSGSTLIACEETDRVCRGIELDPKFVDVIVKRYIEHSADRYEDVYVLRSGQKLKFDEVASFQPEQEDADD